MNRSAVNRRNGRQVITCLYHRLRFTKGYLHGPQRRSRPSYVNRRNIFPYKSSLETVVSEKAVRLHLGSVMSLPQRRHTASVKVVRPDTRFVIIMAQRIMIVPLYPL